MSEQLSNLNKAIVSVMKQVRGMEKKSRVGSGNAAYDGTRDQDVKEAFNEALASNGLCIMPVSIDEDTDISRWEEENQYGKKQKQSVFTKVKVKYLLIHESGESIVLAGYGHGVDSQDKGAGKALTYALKNTLLYTFLTPVGKIEDTDATHSNDIGAPAAKERKPTSKKTSPADAQKVSSEQKIADHFNSSDGEWYEVKVPKPLSRAGEPLGDIAAAGDHDFLQRTIDYIDAFILERPTAKERLEKAIAEAKAVTEGQPQ